MKPHAGPSLLKVWILKLKELSFMQYFCIFFYRANVKLQQCCNDSSRNQYMWYTLLKNGKVHMPKATERKVFIFYSLYAWCLPTILVFFSMTMDFMPTIPSSYLKPNFGSNKCWFSSKWHDFISLNKTLKTTKLILPSKYMHCVLRH